MRNLSRRLFVNFNALSLSRMTMYALAQITRYHASGRLHVKKIFVA